MAPKLAYSDVDEYSKDRKSESIGDGSENEQDLITIPPLLPVPASIVKPDDALCDTCQGLGLHTRQFVVLPSDNEKETEPDDLSVLQLGLVKDIKKKSHCPFCRLVLTAFGGEVPSEADGEEVIVELTWKTEGPRPDANQPWNHIPQIRGLQPSAWTQGGKYITYESKHAFPEIILLANDAPVPNKAFFIRLIHDQIDFAKVRNWLTMCAIWHKVECEESPQPGVELKHPPIEFPHFRLIDVIDNCLVHAPTDCKYVALSYVWGRIDTNTILRAFKNNLRDLEQPGGLLSFGAHLIPVTVRDAMEVVRRLNLRYLWVDSLCIVQDDEGPGGSKMESIAKMDLIYAGAYLTIMAATGTDANAGLPGVRPGTRMLKQPIEEIGPGFRLGYSTKSQDFIESAEYLKRGWTFQERLFSKRSLLFIGGQVVYDCRKASGWREDVVFESDKYLKHGGGLGGWRVDPDNINPFEGFIGNYARLSLTYESDIYNAFAGVIRRFKVELKANLCHGIPDAYFDWFLVWTPSGKNQTRRGSAPSWSWAGWTGGCTTHLGLLCSPSIKSIRREIRTRTWVIWYQRRSHDSEEVNRVWSPSLSEHENFDGSDVPNRFPFDYSKTLPTPRTLDPRFAPKYTEDTFNPSPGSGFLQFWTVSTMFYLDKPTSPQARGTQVLDYSRIGIFGCDGREVGIVEVPPDWAKANVPKLHEFIFLCEGGDPIVPRSDEEIVWKYQIMLIEWGGHQWAERVAVIVQLRRKT